MPPHPNRDDLALDDRQEEKFRSKILKTCFVRFHMGLILASVIATGIVASRFLLSRGFHSMPLRYATAVVVSYGVFLVMVRIWIWWVTSAKLALDMSLLNGSGSNSGGFSFGSSSASNAGEDVKFGGGSSGGGGASDSWGGVSSGGGRAGFLSSGSPPMPISGAPMPDMNQASLAGPPATSGGSGLSGGWFPDLGDIDGDDWWILLLLAILVGAILGGGGYLVYVAPQILPEAAWQAALAGGLHRMTRQRPDWKLTVVRSSALPFTVVLVLAMVLGWQAQKHCPSASRLMQVFSCSDTAPTP